MPFIIKITLLAIALFPYFQITNFTMHYELCTMNFEVKLAKLQLLYYLTLNEPITYFSLILFLLQKKVIYYIVTE